MRNVLRVVSGVIVLLIVLPAFIALLAPVVPARSPYLSALADLGGPEAFAKPVQCAKKMCDTDTSCNGNQLTTKCQFTNNHGTKLCNTVSCT